MAVEAYERGIEMDRRIFAPGTAAHAVLHQVGLHGKDAVAPTCQALMVAGRDGVDAEPPLSPDDVWAGRDLAVRWLDAIEWQVGSESAKYEVGLGFKRGWVPCSYDDPECWYRSRLDVVDVVEADEDEDQWGVGLLARDYKGWPGSMETLETVQLRTHAVALLETWDMFMDEKPDFIRLEVVNLQLRKRYHKDVSVEEDAADLAQWKRDITATVDAAAAKPRVARPGIRCTNCPYVLACKAARRYATATSMKTSLSREELAGRYAVLQAMSDEAKAGAKVACEGGAIETRDGVVGYVRGEKNAVLDDAPETIWGKWAEDDGDIDPRLRELAIGLLQSLHLGVGQVKNAAKNMFMGRPQAAARAEFLNTVLGKKTTKTFKIVKKESK
jgi:hypothetical protein